MLLIGFSSVSENDKLRLLESLELTSKFSDGVIWLYDMEKDEIDDVFSTKYACPHCGYSLSALEPKFFSFNSPAGACSTCDGLGVMEFFDPAKIITNEELSLSSGAIYGWDKKNAFYFLLLDSLANHYKVDIDMPYYKLPKNSKRFYFMEVMMSLIDMKYVKGYRSKNMDNLQLEQKSGMV